MAYSEILASRVRDEMIDLKHYSEKKMFGCFVFMLYGKMACGVIGDDLIVRVGLDAYEDCLAMDSVGVFPPSGKVMRGWVIVGGGTLASRDSLVEWVNKGVSFCLSLTSDVQKQGSYYTLF